MKIGKTMVAALMLASVATAAEAQGRGWVEIGSRTVADNLERDVISGRGDGRFRQIKICVERRAVRFQDVDVVFRNGGRQDVRIRRQIGAGQCTRAIDLNGDRRRIRRVRFIYETIRNRGPQARVVLYGRR